MKLFSAVAGGFAGAAVLTLLHELAKKQYKNAPRLDELGMEAITKTLESVNLQTPETDNLSAITMAGDMITNSFYYSLAAAGDENKVLLRGIFLGLAAGFGAVYLPKPLGLNESSTSRTAETKLITLGLYVAGGIAAAATTLAIEKFQSE